MGEGRKHVDKRASVVHGDLWSVAGMDRGRADVRREDVGLRGDIEERRTDWIGHVPWDTWCTPWGVRVDRITHRCFHDPFSFHHALVRGRWAQVRFLPSARARFLVLAVVQVETWWIHPKGRHTPSLDLEPPSEPPPLCDCSADPGEVRSEQALGGSFSLPSAAGSVHLIHSDPSASLFPPVLPFRLSDQRPGSPPIHRFSIVPPVSSRNRTLPSMDVAHRRLTRSTCFVSIARAPGLLQDLPRASMASLLASRRLVPCPAPRARGAGARARPRARGTAVAVAQEAASDASSASTAPSEDDGFTYERFQELLDKFDFKFKAGDKVTGHVLRIDNRGAYVDIGAKSAAFVPTHEVSIGSLARVRSVEPKEREETRRGDGEERRKNGRVRTRRETEVEPCG